jgi:hypothetical protein
MLYDWPSKCGNFVMHTTSLLEYYINWIYLEFFLIMWIFIQFDNVTYCTCIDVWKNRRESFVEFLIKFEGYFPTSYNGLKKLPYLKTGLDIKLMKFMFNLLTFICHCEDLCNVSNVIL